MQIIESLTNVLSLSFSFMIVILVLVLVHEMGHYLVARFFGVGVECFSIGFGKELCGYTDSHGTRWRLSLLPLGGYVQMSGDSDPASTINSEVLENASKMSAHEKERALIFKPIYQKALVIFAGPAFNLIFAALILATIFFSYGYTTFSPVITKIEMNSPAEKAGLVAGDKVVRANGKDVVSFQDIMRQVHFGDKLVLEVKKADGSIMSAEIKPMMQQSKDRWGEVINTPRIGISSTGGEQIFPGPLKSLALGTYETWEIIKGTMMGFKQIFTGKRPPSELGGPIKIAKYSGESMKQGLSSFLFLLAVLSINLGFINLMPIPVLDGGHLLFYLLEGLRGGKKLSLNFYKYGNFVGMMMILALMGVAFFNDIRGLFS